MSFDPINIGARGRKTRLTHEHTCIVCGRQFSHREPDVQCCGTKCGSIKAARTRAELRSKKKETET